MASNTPETLFNSADCQFMAQALELARRGLGQTSPNPTVGCVIVDKNNRVVGSGFHAGCGLPHAEAVALAEAGQQAQEATVYATLMPCAHTGKTPPCVEALIKAKVK